jgi:endonuclease G
MGRKYFLILFLFPFVLLAQLRDSVYWNTPYFVINYSEILEGPRSIRYSVACPNGTASRKGMDFYTEKGIKTSDNKDYEANEWDKGHMAPAASLNCNQDMLWDTFSYLNSSLQHQSLNRGVWKKLEIRERELATKNEVKVFIRVEYPIPPVKVTAGASIPSGYYKELKIGERRECYYFPNIVPVLKELNDYKCNCKNIIK